jgi:sugar O-acyltransferase (sialic acid O-acetyltransferase NeuD family)
MRTEFVIVGAGGHAREVADIAHACTNAGSDVTLLGFLDDDPARRGQSLSGYSILGDLGWLAENPRVEVVLGIGFPADKRRVAERLAATAPRYRTLVHPRAELTRWVRLGDGAVVAAGCVLTNEITIGDHVHLNRLSTVGHDCVVGDHVHLAPGAVLSGNVTIGEGCDIGTNACAIQGITIGDWSIIGAGATVIRDLPANVTAVGVPARVIATRPDGWWQ